MTPFVLKFQVHKDFVKVVTIITCWVVRLKIITGIVIMNRRGCNLQCYSSIYRLFHPHSLCLSKEVGLVCWQHKDSQLTYLFSVLHFGNAGMSLCPSKQSVFPGGPQGMHSSSSSSRQGRESVQVFPVFYRLVSVICSLALTAWSFEFYVRFSIQLCLDPSVLPSIQPSNNSPRLSPGCVLSQQHLIRRHVMVRRHQSCETRGKPCNYCKCVRVCVEPWLSRMQRSVLFR